MVGTSCSCCGIQQWRGKPLMCRMKFSSKLHLNLGTCTWTPITGAGSGFSLGELSSSEKNRNAGCCKLQLSVCQGSGMVPAICLSDAGGWFWREERCPCPGCSRAAVQSWGITARGSCAAGELHQRAAAMQPKSVVDFFNSVAG